MTVRELKQFLARFSLISEIEICTTTGKLTIIKELRVSENGKTKVPVIEVEVEED